jgi:hypothetical protein
VFAFGPEFCSLYSVTRSSKKPARLSWESPESALNGHERFWGLSLSGVFFFFLLLRMDDKSSTHGCVGGLFLLLLEIARVLGLSHDLEQLKLGV